jgi:hypothetical protein
MLNVSNVGATLSQAAGNAIIRFDLANPALMPIGEKL